ncbi:MAG: hypothetical protein KJ042_03005 [Deltaproteobacteria bacterium]|nr:hypothetical protein [Deltaproteobacteria bacterium]
MNKMEILKLPVPKLRDEAHKIPDLSGISGMNKDQLTRALFEHYGIPLEEAVDIYKDPAVKTGIRAAKKARAEALAAGDRKKAKILQGKVHGLKRTTRQWTKAKVRAKAKKG